MSGTLRYTTAKERQFRGGRGWGDSRGGLADAKEVAWALLGKSSDSLVPGSLKKG